MNRENLFTMQLMISGLVSSKTKGGLLYLPENGYEKVNILDDEKFVLDLLKEKKVLLTHGRGFNWAEPDTSGLYICRILNS